MLLIHIPKSIVAEYIATQAWVGICSQVDAPGLRISDRAIRDYRNSCALVYNTYISRVIAISTCEGDRTIIHDRAVTGPIIEKDTIPIACRFKTGRCR